jgi:hypothetical protein
MNTKKCKCGAEIGFIKMKSGKAMPVDAEPVKAIVTERGEMGGLYGNMQDVYIPHWSTCPLAAEFKKKGD